METLETPLPYLSGSAVIFLLSFLCVAALLEIQSQRHRGVFSPIMLVFMAAAISVLTICLILAADAVFIDNSSGAQSPWSEWGSRLGS
jgi:ABC-type transport system involved in cytochrome c biogenesis permease subunit